MTPELLLENIEQTKHDITPYTVTTPVHRLRGRQIESILGTETEVFLKLELLQVTGTFKPRGALNVMLNSPMETLAKGVTAVSAGNHAIAVAYAAKALGTSAKVVMIKTANPFRIEAARAFGADVEVADSGALAFERVEEIQATEGRMFVHPFEGPYTSLGTATVGLEWCRQVQDMDAVIVPIGGGGLMSGIATAVKLLQPRAEVIGVEPVGADIMHRSFQAGAPVRMHDINTIADSLAPPFTEPLSYELCRKHVDRLVRVSDRELKEAMVLLFNEAKLAVEPAGAASTAALCGPLRDGLRGKRIGAIVCGSNIDLGSYSKLVADFL